MFRSLLFDFDGTLADSFAGITASTNHARQVFGLPALSEAVVRSYVGHGLAHLMSELVPTAPTVDQAVTTYRTHHETVAIPMTKLFPGVVETITWLFQRGHHLGVCSNKSVTFTKKLVAHLFPAGEFNVVLGPEDVGSPKPDPAMLLEACRRLTCLPKDTVYVGDMHVDVLTAKAAQMDCWLIDGGAGGEKGWQMALAAGPTLVLDSFAQIREVIEAREIASPRK
jgi:HAD superfamily hydrolase (TIGR01509 family)